MAQHAPDTRDRFDEVPVGGARGGRVGAHRAVPRQRSFGKWVLAVVVLTLICSLGGIIWLMRVGADSTVFSSVKNEQTGQQSSTNTADVGAGSASGGAQADAGAGVGSSGTGSSGLDTNSGQQTIQPQPNPDATVTVLNGTETAGLAAGARDRIGAEGWGTVTAVGNAETVPVSTSVVYYTSSANADAAAGLADKLGMSRRLDASYNVYGTDLVVVLGADYAP